MSTRQKNQRRPIKASPSGKAMSSRATRMIRAFKDFDSTDEQVKVFARLARIVADALDEDCQDHGLMDNCRHELADAEPLEQVRRELGLDNARRAGRKR